MTSDTQHALLLARVEELTAEVRHLLDRMPSPSRQWLNPTEFARMVGCSTRTLTNWRNQGRFQSHSIRSTGNRFQFHAQRALDDIEQAKA